MKSRREFLKYLAASPLLTEYSAFAQEVEETLGARLTDPFRGDQRIRNGSARS